MSDYVQVEGRGLLSNKCNDGFHEPSCNSGYFTFCECQCHNQQRKPRVSGEPKSEKTIMEVYGTIDV